MKNSVIAIQDVEDGTWPNTVTQKQSFNYSFTDNRGVKKTVVGTASFEWKKAKLSVDNVKFPNLLLDINEGIVRRPLVYNEATKIYEPDYNFESDSIIVEVGEYLPYRIGVGKMPGWQVVFGEQIPIKDAYTQTIHYPPNSDPQAPPPPKDEVTKSDALPRPPYMVCAQAAPGLFCYQGDIASLEASNNVFVAMRSSVATFYNSVNDGIPGEYKTDDSGGFTKTLIRNRIPAGENNPAYGALYRIEFPAGILAIKGNSYINLNESKFHLSREADERFYYIDGLIQYWFNYFATVYQRSLTTYDIVLDSDVQSFSPGELKYLAAVSDFGSAGQISIYENHKLENPFQITGLSYDEANDEIGFRSVTTF